MSEQSTPEPTMEEILASIRRIISEDEAPAEAAPSEPEPEPEPEPAAAPAVGGGIDDQIAAIRAAAGVQQEDDDDGDLELTQKVETHGDLDFVEPEPAPETESPAEPDLDFEPEAEPMMEAPAALPSAGALVSDHVAAAAAATFGRLSSNILMPAEGRTLEDVVREMLRPMLQQWLDDNLPGIVQQAVDSEVERISRGRVR
jgi:cell pole-organizing protein PopZ